MNKRDAEQLANEAWTRGGGSGSHVVAAFAHVLQMECQARSAVATREGARADHAEAEIKRLADWIMLNAPERITGSAVDTVIEILEDLSRSQAVASGLRRLHTPTEATFLEAIDGATGAPPVQKGWPKEDFLAWMADKNLYWEYKNEADRADEPNPATDLIRGFVEGIEPDAPPADQHARARLGEDENGGAPDTSVSSCAETLMERKIWKYRLPATAGPFRIDMPSFTKILSVQAQDDGVFLWAAVPTALIECEVLPPDKRVFLVVMTGEEYEADGLTYLATVQREGYVYHVHEVMTHDLRYFNCDEEAAL